MQRNFSSRTPKFPFFFFPLVLAQKPSGIENRTVSWETQSPGVSSCIYHCLWMDDLEQVPCPLPVFPHLYSRKGEFIQFGKKGLKKRLGLLEQPSENQRGGNEKPVERRGTAMG